MNKVFKNKVLGEVCSFSKQVEDNVLLSDVERTLGDAEDDTKLAANAVCGRNNGFEAPIDTVFQFLDAFQTAMCGEPGKGLAEILEKVVRCFIDCKNDEGFCNTITGKFKGGDAFCSGGVVGTFLPAPRPPTSSSDTIIVRLKYEKLSGTACGFGGEGIEGPFGDLQVFNDVTSVERCESICDRENLDRDTQRCRGYDYHSGKNRCRMFHKFPTSRKEVTSVDCFLKT